MMALTSIFILITLFLKFPPMNNCNNYPSMSIRVLKKIDFIYILNDLNTN